MPEEVRSNYEGKSEGAVVHWEIPYARLEDATPTPSNPCAVLNITPGFDQLTGVILSIDAGDSVAVVDFTCGMVYRLTCRNATGYGAGVENAWAAINIGDFIYYDGTGPVAGTYLSMAAADNAAVATAFFGHVVPLHDTDLALYPKGAGGVGSTQTIGVMIRGAGS